MRKINWKCPECGRNKIEAVALAIFASPIVGLEENEDIPVYDTNKITSKDGDVNAIFQCEYCGKHIMEGTDKQFVEYMEKYRGNKLYYLMDGDTITVDGYELFWDHVEKKLIPSGISADPRYYCNDREVDLLGDGLIEILNSEKDD